MIRILFEIHQTIAVRMHRAHTLNRNQTKADLARLFVLYAQSYSYTNYQMYVACIFKDLLVSHFVHISLSSLSGHDRVVIKINYKSGASNCCYTKSLSASLSISAQCPSMSLILLCLHTNSMLFMCVRAFVGMRRRSFVILIKTEMA